MTNSFTNKFLAVYAIVLTFVLFFITEKNASLHKKNESLHTEIQLCKDSIKTKEAAMKEEIESLNASVQMREAEISYWGRLYDAMKNEHPATAKKIEKQQ